ncbi:MAG: TauD/TfdA family dioxygenase [Acidimicrobiales bacterium]
MATRGEHSTVRARRLPGAPFGASVDLARGSGPLGPSVAHVLRDLLAHHHLLVLRGEWSEAEHIDLVGCFGRVLPQGPRVVVNDHPVGELPLVTFVSNIAAVGGLGPFELAFHHDLAHVATPLGGLSLYAVDVADGQAPTRFANGHRAYLQLPPQLQDRLVGLQGLFAANYTTTSDQAASARDVRDALHPTWPRTVHPVVVPHPVTGESCVYVNEMMTVEILGLDRADGDALLDALFERLYDPINIYEHHWQNGDLVVWDNLVVQHARQRLHETTPRTLRRVVFGEKTPWEQWPYPVAAR